jgi:hypothetical protein
MIDHLDRRTAGSPDSKPLLTTEQRPGGDTLDQSVVELVAVHAVVDASVASRTQCDHVVRVTGSIVAESVEMVDFEVRLAVGGRERSALSTALTGTIGDTEGEPADDFTPSVLDSFAVGTVGLRRAIWCGSICEFVQFFERKRVEGWCSSHLDTTDGAEFEAVDCAEVAVHVGERVLAAGDELDLADVGDDCGFLLWDALEEEDATTILGVGRQRLVVPFPRLVAFLSDTSEEEVAVREPLVVIPVLGRIGRGEQEDRREVRDRRDTGLLVPAAHFVKVFSDVLLTDLERTVGFDLGGSERAVGVGSRHGGVVSPWCLSSGGKRRVTASRSISGKSYRAWSCQ